MAELAVVMHWCGDWEYCRNYEVADVARRGGVLFLCLEQNAGRDPRDEFNRNFWMPFGEGGGEGTLNHEELLNRLGVGADGKAYHFTGRQHAVLVDLALVPNDGNTYGIRFNASTQTFVWVQVSGGGEMKFYRGLYATEADLVAAHPTDVMGAYAIVLETQTFWIWGGLAQGWVDTDSSALDIEGIPPGGVTGQVLTKRSNADGDADWADPAGGAGGNHNDMSGIQGGAPTERYHLTEAGAYLVDQWLRKAPDQPVNLAPFDTETNIEERPEFESSPYFHPYGYEMYLYQLQIMDSGGNIVFDTGQIDRMTVRFRLPAGVLLQNGSYTWQVRYCGSNMVWSRWSDPTGFKTMLNFATATIMPPSLILPGDKSIVNTQTPVLLTTPFDTGSGLTQGAGDFQVAETPGFSPLVEAGTGMNSYNTTTQLTRGKEYYARANHKNDDGSVTSRWSRIISFVVRTYYRKPRIGLVLQRDNGWMLTRIDENFNPVDLDAEYWLNHGVYAGLNASRNDTVQFADVNANAYAMSTLPAFYIRNGIVPRGPFTGKRFWMIDTNAPSAQDEIDGWHLHGAFKSVNFGDQDSILIGRNALAFYGTTPSLASIRIPDGQTDMSGSGRYYAPSMALRDQWLSAMNNDATNPNRRGWAVAPYTINGAIRLLLALEQGSFAGVVSRYRTAKDNSLYGLYPYIQSTISYYTYQKGLGFSKAILPGEAHNAIAYPITPANTEAAHGNFNDFYRDSDGPVNMHMGDYMIGIRRAVGGPDADVSILGGVRVVSATEADKYTICHEGLSRAGSDPYGFAYCIYSYAQTAANMFDRIVKYH